MMRLHPRRGRGDRGAALVEMALVSPIVFLVTFAIIEGGLWFKDYLTVGYATRNGARAAIAQDADSLADWDILRAVDKGLNALNRGDLELVVIFKADGFDDEPSASCMGGVGTSHLSDPANACNVYFPADLERSYDDFRSDSYPNRQNWPGELRDITETGGTDYVGVYVRAHHQMITGIYGDSRKIEDTSVMRIEPKLS